MDLKIKLEISNLVRKGFTEDVAFLTTVMKYKKEYERDIERGRDRDKYTDREK